MSEAIIVGLLAFLGTVISNYFIHNKTMALLNYRLDGLEDRVNKHNNLVERMYKVESDVRTAFLRVDEINEKLDK